MKMNMKVCLAAVAMAFCGMANAQKLPNGSFDSDWVSCYPWEKGEYVKTARGTQPEGWCISNVNGMGGLGATVVGSEVTPGYNNTKKAVNLTNTPNPLSASQIVPGYMTLGTTWATAKATMGGSVSEGTADGGVFGGIDFNYRPDALRLHYKRSHNINKSEDKNTVNTAEKASIIAYAWKGTWTQVDVPCNTSLNNPTKKTMTDRSNNVLGKDCILGGTVSKTDDAELISVIEYYIEGDQSDWKEITIPFEYKSDEKPTKFNIIIAANDIFAERSGIGVGNQIIIDNVELVYNSYLAGGATYNGADLRWSAGKATVDEVYDASKLVLESNGKGATIERSYDEATAKLTVIVKGEDISVNSGNFHKYEIQFKSATPTVGSLAKTINAGTSTKAEIDNMADKVIGK